MDINRIVRQCFLQYGYAEGVCPMTKLEYSLFGREDKEAVQDVSRGLSCRKRT